MNIAELMPQNAGRRKIEESQNIQITKNTVRFGNSVYQFRNITGFEIGELAKGSFSWKGFFILVALGVFTLPLAGLGLVFIGLAAYSLFNHFKQAQAYGLVISLNSGEELFFKTTRKQFISEVVGKLYDFMENVQEGSVSIDMRNYSISVKGDVSGSLIAGSDNKVHSMTN
jgi:hypothetical protein